MWSFKNTVWCTQLIKGTRAEATLYLQSSWLFSLIWQIGVLFLFKKNQKSMLLKKSQSQLKRSFAISFLFSRSSQPKCTTSYELLASIEGRLCGSIFNWMLTSWNPSHRRPNLHRLNALDSVFWGPGLRLPRHHPSAVDELAGLLRHLLCWQWSSL